MPHSNISNKKKVKGQKNEYVAAGFMTDNNYFISWRQEDNAPYDFAATDRITGKTRLIDAKTVSFRKTWKPGTRICRVLSKYQKQLGVEILYVYPDGRCDFHGKD